MNAPQTAAELQQRFSIPGLEFTEGNGGLVRGTVNSPVCHGEFYLYGAHVTAFHPSGQSPILWMSHKSHFEVGKPIRGGIPLCFPWFGPHPSDASAPAHGMARTTAWTMTAASRLGNGGIGVELQLVQADFSLIYRVKFGAHLELELSVTSLAERGKTLTYEEALHSYFQVADIHRVRIRGLEGTPLLDKVMGGQRLPGSDAAIEFGGETDRVYAPTRADCTILDPGMHRAIEIQKSGSQTTVVWNPWISKSAKMPDFGDDEWPGMVCVETANVGEYAVVIHPHDTHVMRVGISSRPLLPGEL